MAKTQNVCSKRFLKERQEAEKADVDVNLSKIDTWELEAEALYRIHAQVHFSVIVTHQLLSILHQMLDRKHYKSLF